MLHVGFGTGDITPTPGMEIPGGFAKLIAKGVRDPLHAIACVVYDGETAVALVGIDSLVVDPKLTDQARREIAKQTQIPGDNVLIGANHTHTGGPCRFGFGFKDSSDSDDTYLRIMVKGVTDAVVQAWNSLHGAEIGIGTGHEPSIAYNRRFLMKDGREITHPGKPGTPHSHEIVRPAGPTDPDVGVLAVRTPGGKLTGVVVNFACHSTIMGGDQFSADYAGQLRKHLRAKYGENFPVVFLLGCCGDLTQVNNLVPGREFGPEYCDMVGMKLAAETHKTINRMEWLKEAPIAVNRQTPILSIRPEPDVDRERPPFGLGSGEGVEPSYADGRKLVAELREKQPKFPAEVMGVHIGPLGIATNGAEYFCEYGLRIKACSPHKTTWVISLANDWLGYVPTPHAFIAGGYEPRTARSSRLSIDAGQILLESGLVALNKVYSPTS